MNGNVSPVLLLAIPGDLSATPRSRWEYDQKLPLLMDHFGIRKDDPDHWYKLAVCLAVKHVPGFQEKARRKGGRPRAMTIEEETTLYAKFCEFRQNGHTERNAARLLANDLQKPGHSKVSRASILRRMQRCAQKARNVAALPQSMNGVFR
jgi:hypothetical protein